METILVLLFGLGLAWLNRNAETTGSTGQTWVPTDAEIAAVLTQERRS